MRKKVKRKKKHHLNRLKIRKVGSSWFKLVYFDLLAELKKRLKISIFLWRKSCASRCFLVTL